MEDFTYLLGPLVMAILFGVSFAFWNWYSKQQGGNDDFQLPHDDGSSELNTSSFDKLLSRNDADILSGSTDKYDWMQNERELEVYIPVAHSVRGKDVSCTIDADILVVMVNGEIVLEGNFYAPVDPEECNWQIDGDGDDRKIWISLYKETPTTKNQHWKCVLEGDAEIDTSSLGPPVHRLDINDKESMKNAFEKVQKYK